MLFTSLYDSFTMQNAGYMLKAFFSKGAFKEKSQFLQTDLQGEFWLLTQKALMTVG